METSVIDDQVNDSILDKGNFISEGSTGTKALMDTVESVQGESSLQHAGPSSGQDPP